jgi:CheY-like chemotaxis protein
MTGATVLIVSTDSFAGALLGALLEIEGYRVTFHDDARETPEAAVARAQPRIIIVDVDHPDAFTQPVLERHRAMGIAIVAFSPTRPSMQVHERATPHKLKWFALPADRETICAALVEAGGHESL